MILMERPRWWDGALWFRVYAPGGYDGYKTIGGRKLPCATLATAIKRPDMRGEVRRMASYGRRRMSDNDGLYFGPCLNPSGTGETWTDEQLDQFRAEWRRKWQDGTFGRPRLMTLLPRRVRLRLAAQRAVDGVAIWLCAHGRHGDAAALWWWLTGGWW